MVAAARPHGTVMLLLSPLVPRYAMVPLAEELLLSVLRDGGPPRSQ